MGAVAALLALGACASPPPADPLEARRMRENIDAGLAFYESGDYVLAANRFRDAAEGAGRLRELSVERKATTGECTAWLRARELDEFSACTVRLEELLRRERRPDPGLNTMIVMGALAGGRSTPPLRVPNAVHPIVRAAAEE